MYLMLATDTIIDRIERRATKDVHKCTSNVEGGFGHLLVMPMGRWPKIIEPRSDFIPGNT